MPLPGRIRRRRDSTQPASCSMETPHILGQGYSSVRFTRFVFAVFIAIVGCMLILQQATAESASDTGAGQYRVYLALVSAGSGPANRAVPATRDGAISVTARAGLSCSDGETVPVRGARITVITDESSRIAMTDETGNVLFSATAEPAVVQIEWPVGFLPCPNSRPVVELPAGTGEVEFIAIAGP